LRFNLAAYYNLYENFILTFDNVGFDAEDLMLFQSRNIGSATIYGVEAKAEVPFGYADVLQGFSVLATFGYSEGVDEDTDQPIDTVDPLQIGGALKYVDRKDRWGAELAMLWVNRQERVSEPSEPDFIQFVPPDYFRVDLKGFVHITEYVTLTAGIYNLTNEKYWEWQDVRGLSATLPDIERYAQPGINLRASLTVRF
jgi:hemoglobin/transferrin/lactoferrin receptor protein